MKTKNIKKLLPIEDITYRTILSADDALIRINSDGRYDYVSRGSKDAAFSIKRIISYRNSFSPIIEGFISEDITGTIVRVKMRLHRFVLIFSICCFCFSLFATIASIKTMISDGFDIIYLTPFGMLIFLYLMVYGGFKFESMKVKEDIRSILDAEIIE